MRGEIGKRSSSWQFAGLLVGVWSVSLFLAYHKLLWFDELMTLYVARRPSLGDLWATLCDGPDPAPPLHLLAVRWSIDLLGENRIALRIPAMLGFLLMIVSLKLLTNKGLSPSGSWVAAIAPLATYGFVYAFEARAYGLWMGLTALAFWLWSESTAGETWSNLAAVGLAVTLAAAISTHWYAVLLVIPLGLGEVERTLRTGRVAPNVWLALGLGFLPLLFYGPLLANGRQYSGNFWAKPTWDALPTTYGVLLRWPLFMLVVVGLFVLMDKFRPAVVRPLSRIEPSAQSLPRHVFVAAVTLVCLPVAELALARLMHAGYTVRYALPSVVGLALLMASFAQWLDQRGLLKAQICVGILLSGAIGLNVQSVIRTPDYYSWTTRRPPFPAILDGLPTDSLPLVITDATRFLPLAYYYGDNGLGRSIVYLPHLNPEQDTLWISMRKLRPIVDLSIVDLEQFLREQPRFYLVEGKIPYLREAIETGGAKVVIRTQVGDESLYEVTRNTLSRSDADQQP